MPPTLNYSIVPDVTPPLSAGSETFSCKLCNLSDNTTSATITQVPHATWTNTRGEAVVLLDTVLLGGINGLNN